MSHELRTPLNSLLLLSRLLAEDPEHNMTDKQREFASTIHNAGSDLLLLIDDILDLSKIEAGRVDVEAGPVDLAEIRAYVLAAFGPQAEEKSLELQADLAPDLPATITTDPQRLQQILRNLLSNAVKFTGSGIVRLRIELAAPTAVHGIETLDAARAVVAFVVSDTGIGISEEKLGMIFEAFQQADGTTSRKYGGTGLGLSISKELARMLGGVIRVSSQPGVGSEFTLLLPDELPAEQPDELPAAPAPQPLRAGTMKTDLAPILAPTLTDRDNERPSPQLSGVTVLIIDDDVRNVFVLTSALELHGLRALYADNGSDGIDLLTKNPAVDIVLMDSMMPDLDGNETTRKIRALPHGRDLPVVFLSAKAMPGDRESSLSAGASDYLTKPVDKDRLLAVMASWVSQSRAKAAGTS
jgi:CheY-like chemotaxis protein